MRVVPILTLLSLLILLGCDSGYDYGKYEDYKNDGELSDAVHEWIADYVEQYCSADADGSISCK